VPVVVMWDRLVESVIVVETPLLAVSQMGATHNHLRTMELPRCWWGATYDNRKDHDTHRIMTILILLPAHIVYLVMIAPHLTPQVVVLPMT